MKKQFIILVILAVASIAITSCISVKDFKFAPSSALSTQNLEILGVINQEFPGTAASNIGLNIFDTMETSAKEQYGNDVTIEIISNTETLAYSLFGVMNHKLLVSARVIRILPKNTPAVVE